MGKEHLLVLVELSSMHCRNGGDDSASKSVEKLGVLAQFSPCNRKQLGRGAGRLHMGLHIPIPDCAHVEVPGGISTGYRDGEYETNLLGDECCVFLNVRLAGDYEHLSSSTSIQHSI